jgi:hypothetical protein
MKNPTGEKFYSIIFPIGEKSHKHFRFGNVSHIFEKFSHSLFQMGFLPNSQWENFSQMNQMGETFPNRKCLWDFFLPMGKNNRIGFFSRGIFHGTANRSENPAEIPWGFMF